MQQAIQVIFSLFDQYELPILLILLFVEADGLFLPISGDIFLLIANTRQPPSFLMTGSIVLVSVLGTSLGAFILYSITSRIGHEFVEKYGKFILLSPNRLHKLEGFYQQHGRLAIPLGWIIPGLRVSTAIMAGVSGIKPKHYLPYALLGSICWTALYTGIGIGIYSQGSTVGAFTYHLSKIIPTNLIIGIIIGGIAIFIISHIFYRFWARRRYYLQRIEKTIEGVAEHVEEIAGKSDLEM